VAQNYFAQAAEAGNANAMAFLGKVTFIGFYLIMLSFVYSTVKNYSTSYLLFDE